jgi:hypothetical protein
MTQTSTLCSHRSISHSIGELWSMPCIISWAPALRARPPQDVGQSLLVVVLRRLPEPAARKIAVQEPPSSAGHNDVPPADLAPVSTGRDAGQGAYPGCQRRRSSGTTRSSPPSPRAVRLAVHRLFMLIVTKRPEASSRKPREAERCDIPLEVITWADFAAL